jgi:hypothetical protein
MTEKPTLLLKWISADGKRKSILMVKDDELDPSDADYRRLELCIREDEEWRTEEWIDSLAEIEAVGIPEEVGD